MELHSQVQCGTANFFIQYSNRKSVLPHDLEEPLKEYLGFRHVFRHSYGYELDWERLNPLFSGMPEIWQKIKKGLIEFIK